MSSASSSLVQRTLRLAVARHRLAALASRNSAATATTTTTVRRALSTAPAARQVLSPDGNTKGKGKGEGEGKEIGVGELEGAKFRIEPMRRVGEDDRTMRARLTYQSRKRGTLESDLLLSTFADALLPAMTRGQMEQYDRFLDENDWDIYYWATQDPPSPTAATTSPSSASTAATTSDPSYGSGAEAAIASSAAADTTTTTTTITTATAEEAIEAEAIEGEAETEPYNNAGSGEWAQTVGAFKPAYRPVPARWRDSEVLALLREHVRRQAGRGGGMAFMPALRP